MHDYSHSWRTTTTPPPTTTTSAEDDVSRVPAHATMVDVEFISLPFLLFKDGILETANSGAKVLLGLTDLDAALHDGYCYKHDDLFPPSIAAPQEGNRLKSEGHLQILRAKVQSSSEHLKLKAAVYNSEDSQRVKSILVVDVSLLPGSTSTHRSSFSSSSTAPPSLHHHHLHKQPTAPGEEVPDHSVPCNARLEESSRAASTQSSTSSSAVSQQQQQHHHHIPSVIKRHSGDIKKIIGATMERRKSQQHSKRSSVGSISLPSPVLSASDAATFSSQQQQPQPQPDRRSESYPSVDADDTYSPAIPDIPTPIAEDPSSPPTSSVFQSRRDSADLSNSTRHGSTTSPSLLPALDGRVHDKSASTLSHHLGSIPISGAAAAVKASGDDSSSMTSRSRPLSHMSLNLPRPFFSSHSAEEDFTAALAQSALASHPRTGVIISKMDLSSGFINSRTRELLMGIKSPTDEVGDPLDDQWYAPRSMREKYRRHIDDEEDGEDDGDHDDHDDEFDRGRQHGETDEEGNYYSPGFEDDDIIFEDGKVKIDLPTHGANLQTTISDILKWSLRRRRVRQHKRLLRDDMSIRSGASYSPPTSVSGGLGGLHSHSHTHPHSTARSDSMSHMSTHSRSRDEAVTVMEATLDPPRPWLAHKPYKVYDDNFSQRVEDPFERLFDQCVRRGEQPPENCITVGIETEVGPIETCKFPEHECFTYLTEGTDPNNPTLLVPTRVRRRIIQARASPLKDVNGEHMGGVVWLRDITGEATPPPVIPSIEPGKTDTGAGSKGLSNNDSAKHPKSSVVEQSETPGFQAPSIAGGGGSSDPFWQQIINSMPQMVWVTKPDGSHIYFNNKWYTYTGLQPEQSLGVNWQNPFHPDDMPSSRRAWSRSLATGEPYSVEYRCRRHDGVWRWQLGRAQALFDAKGKIIAWFGTCTDVEEFVHIRNKLAETSQNLHNVIDLANITLLSVNKDLNILFMEGGGALRKASCSDISNTAIVGKPLSYIIDSPAVLGAASDIIAGAESARVEVQIKAEVWIGCHLTPLKSATGECNGAVIVASDVTDLKEAEAALKQSYEEQSRLLASETAAKEASRLKSEFTANLSHEIRTPITGMLGMSELLLDEDMTPAQHDCVRKILKSGEILLNMVGEVLDLGKVEAGKLELDIQPFVLSDLVQDAVAMFKTAANKKGLKFNDDCCDNLYKGPILGDLPRLRQVLLNFLANSVKFTKHGFITLQVKQDEETPSSILLRFVVEDSGIGIAKDVIPLLFQAFQQADSSTSREHGGTGLGLVISKRLVELMNGTVKLDSELGKGTTITVTIPFQKALSQGSLVKRTSHRKTGAKEDISGGPAVRPSIPTQNSGSPSDSLAPTVIEIDRSKVHILLAEDNPLNSEIFVKGLTRMGFNVKAVSNGVDAVAAMSERKWDIVLMDGFMPKMDGYEATRTIRQSEDPDIRNTTIIALTASAIAGDKERCLGAGMNAYLSKPVRLKLLEETVMHHLQQQLHCTDSTPSSPALAAV